MSIRSCQNQTSLITTSQFKLIIYSPHIYNYNTTIHLAFTTRLVSFSSEWGATRMPPVANINIPFYCQLASFLSTHFLWQNCQLELTQQAEIKCMQRKMFLKQWLTKLWNNIKNVIYFHSIWIASLCIWIASLCIWIASLCLLFILAGRVNICSLSHFCRCARCPSMNQ